MLQNATLCSETNSEVGVCVVRMWDAIKTPQTLIKLNETTEVQSVAGWSASMLMEAMHFYYWQLVSPPPFGYAHEANEDMGVMCACAHGCVAVWTYIWTCMRRGEDNLGYHSLEAVHRFFFFILRQGFFLACSLLSRQGSWWQWAHLRDLLVSTFSSWFQVCATMSAFLCACQRLNFVPHASILLTELLKWSMPPFFFFLLF